MTRNAANLRAYRRRWGAEGYQRIDCMISAEAFETLCEICDDNWETYSAAVERVLIEYRNFRKKVRGE